MVKLILCIRAERYITSPTSAISNPQNMMEFCMMVSIRVYDLAMYMATKPVMTSASVIHRYTLRNKAVWAALLA